MYLRRLYLVFQDARFCTARMSHLSQSREWSERVTHRQSVAPYFPISRPLHVDVASVFKIYCSSKWSNEIDVVLAVSDESRDAYPTRRGIPPGDNFRHRRSVKKQDERANKSVLTMSRMTIRSDSILQYYVLRQQTVNLRSVRNRHGRAVDILSPASALSPGIHITDKAVHEHVLHSTVLTAVHARFVCIAFALVFGYTLLYRLPHPFWEHQCDKLCPERGLVS